MADSYMGEIRAFAGTYAPADWNICDGSLISVSENPALFSLIGTFYGGDGVQTFALPDLRGRLAISMGQGTGLTERQIGSNGGSETVTLDVTTLPAHNHTFTVSQATTPANTNAPAAGSYLGEITSPGAGGAGYLPGNATGLAVKPLNAAAVTNAGGNSQGVTAAHNNIMPVSCINYIICVNGIYPVKP